MSYKDGKPINLIDTINEDCKLWMQLNNEGKMLESYLRLVEESDSCMSRMYTLELNGGELWWGTLPEINAIVKSMIKRIEKDDFLDD